MMRSFAFGPFALLTYGLVSVVLDIQNSLLPTNEHNPQKFIEHRAPSTKQKKAQSTDFY